MLFNQSLADADFEAIGDVCRVLEPAGEKLCVPILRRANVFKKLGGTGVDDVVGYNHTSWGEEAFAFSQLEVSDVLCLDVVKEKQDLGTGSVFIGSSLVSASIVVGTGSLGRGNEVLDDAGKLWDHVTARSLEPCDSVLDSCVGKYLVGNGGSFAAGLDGDDGDVGGRCTRHPGGRVAPKHAQLDHNVWSYTSQNVVQNGALDVAHVHHGVGPAKSIDGINHRLGIALFGLRLDVCNQIMSKRHLLLLLCMRIVEIVCLDREWCTIGLDLAGFCCVVLQFLLVRANAIVMSGGNGNGSLERKWKVVHHRQRVVWWLWDVMGCGMERESDGSRVQHHVQHHEIWLEMICRVAIF